MFRADECYSIINRVFQGAASVSHSKYLTFCYWFLSLVFCSSLSLVYSPLVLTLDLNDIDFLHKAVISETSTIKKIMNVLSLGEIVAMRCGSDLYPKKVTKGTQVRHVKLLTKTSLNKGNIVKIIPRDEHIVHIEKNKGTTTGEV
jgi:hypothetical protein